MVSSSSEDAFSVWFAGVGVPTLGVVRAARQGRRGPMVWWPCHSRCAGVVSGTVGGALSSAVPASCHDVGASVVFGCGCGKGWGRCSLARNGVAAWQGGGELERRGSTVIDDCPWPIAMG